MRKKLTLTIDADVYDMIKDLPRKVSISEVVSHILKAMYQDIKKGRELTQEETQAWIDSDPKLRDFQDRLIEHWGPGFKKLEGAVEKVKNSVSLKKKKKK